MSRSELERLARIRIQVTGETLERAMAVLEGQMTHPPAPAGTETEPDPDPAGNDEVRRLGVAGESKNEDAEDDEDTAPRRRLALPDGGRRTPRKRNHLRGL
ncbi:hypothetical protein AB0G60_17080 [Streptomyces angustmyceticus]|uniref:hypothetical protein n=1 Tax=Streptomyces angustmyceticus TaxID=285578 RepID=UPI00117F915D|nr:hypothetical protein [Streptomyces angustmyceticus]UAL71028.1 hypothetical protein K7396_34535 [Streptomyces angustmyceticus]